MKKRFIVSGIVPNIGSIREFVSAYSIKQALLLIANRLKKKHGHTVVFLGDCVVTER